MNSLAEQIEAHLISQKDWVPTRELCAMFGIKERQLRRIGDQPGLCSGFAISKKGAFRHVYFASHGEWEDFSNKLKAHAVGELVRIRDLRRVRKDATRLHHARQFEKDTGQAVMPM